MPRSHPTPTRRPPGHLRTPTKRWWQDVVGRWELEPHHVHLLTAAAECLDRMAEAREVIAREG